MVLKFGQTRGEDVAELIAKKQYTKAIEIIKSQLSLRDPRIRLQLADVLVQAKRGAEAVTVLIPLADEYARDGFAAKAVAVLKRIQKIDPQRRDVEARLAGVIEQKQKEATLPLIAAPPRLEFGFEEIQPGLELGLELGSASVPAAPAARPAGPPVAAEGEELDLGAVAVPAAPPVARRPPAPAPAPVEDHDLAFGDVEPLVLEPDPAPAEPVLEAEPLIEAEAEAEVEAEPDPLDDELFTQELLSVIDGVFPGSAEEASAKDADGDQAGSARQIVVSPLFRDFSVDEMVAVIQGLKLLSYERGAVILREGQGGGSLYMLTSGRVRAFKKGTDGKQNPLGDLKEGAFFGEMSILTGQPRMASVVALARCELLELDRPTLDEITKAHPHVWDVLREFAEQRRAAAQG